MQDNDLTLSAVGKDESGGKLHSGQAVISLKTRHRTGDHCRNPGKRQMWPKQGDSKKKKRGQL